MYGPLLPWACPARWHPRSSDGGLRSKLSSVYVAMRPILIATRCRREVCPPRPLSLACSSHLSRTVGYPSRTLLPCWALRAGLCHGLVVRHRRSRFRYIESTETTNVFGLRNCI